MSGISRRAIVVGGAAALLAGCSAPSGNKVFVVTETETPDVTVDKSPVPDPVQPVVWPLTGVPVDRVAARPAMSVKIENSAASRPQTGLNAADVVWEEMVEGGLTRFNAVFHSSVPAVVGPIRSLRPMDAAISAPFEGLFVFSGGQGQFIRQVARTGLTMLSFDDGDAGFYRSGNRVAPHNVYGNTDAFLAAGGDTPPPAQFEFARYPEQVSALAGGRVTRIRLTFPLANPGWQWDGDRYLRDEGGSAARVADGRRLAAENVVVLRVEVRNTGATDAGGNPVPETILTGSGRATVFSAGRAISATWTKPEVGSVLALTTADDEPVLLTPGRTWVELLPLSGGSATTA